MKVEYTYLYLMSVIVPKDCEEHVIIDATEDLLMETGFDVGIMTEYGDDYFLDIIDSEEIPDDPIKESVFVELNIVFYVYVTENTIGEDVDAIAEQWLRGHEIPQEMMRDGHFESTGCE